MKIIILILISIFTLSLNAQNNWVKPNAKWYFSIGGGHIGGYQKVEHVGDTLIEGNQCMVFQETKYFLYPQPNSPAILSAPILEGKQYLHYRNDTVFYRIDNRFEVLFDFNANTGDSYVLNSDADTSILACDTVATIHVLATENLLLNSETYKSMSLAMDSVSPMGFYGKYNSRFGPYTQGYLFPTRQSCTDQMIVEFATYSLLCFEDDELSYSSSNANCEHLSNILQIKNIEAQTLGVFPNPVESGSDLFVNLEGNYNLMDINGKSISTGKVNNQKISTAGIRQGVYILSISSEKGTAQQKIIVK